MRKRRALLAFGPRGFSVLPVQWLRAVVALYDGEVHDRLPFPQSHCLCVFRGAVALQGGGIIRELDHHHPRPGLAFRRLRLRASRQKAAAEFSQRLSILGNVSLVSVRVRNVDERNLVAPCHDIRSRAFRLSMVSERRRNGDRSLGARSLSGGPWAAFDAFRVG